jgi:ferredoxin--NADP+ reductase
MHQPRIAIVGSGPSGFFAAEALFKSDIGAQIDIFDRLPTPYGLVRSGVAPDHQHIKLVARVFEAVAKNPRFAFFGNVEVGRDVSLDDLRSRYDAVILAYGASVGAALEIPGCELAQSISAADFVGWYNGHPERVELNLALDCKRAIVVGHGNVAIDVARILLSEHSRLASTDIADHALDALRNSDVRCVHLVGRRGPLQASFTTAELRELLGLPGLNVTANEEVMQLSEEEGAFLELPQNAALKRNFKAITEAIGRPLEEGGKELHLQFLASPSRLLGSERVESMEFARNRLTGPGGETIVATDERFRIDTGLVISSIGFRGRPLGNVPFDKGRGIVPNIEGRVIGETGDGAPLYVAGWIKRGATGIIGTNRADATETVRTMLTDFRDGRWSMNSKRAGGTTLDRSTSFSGWRRIDEAECASGQASGRPRRKIVDLKAMIDIANAAVDELAVESALQH